MCARARRTVRIATLDMPRPTPADEERMWDKLRPATFVAVWRKGEDMRSVFRIMEVLNASDEEFSAWDYVHGGAVLFHHA